MSGIALVWAANVKGLKPHTKIVLIQLADFHNKETGRCFPSAKLLADECEMDRATVFRHLNILIEKGLITRHARGDGKGGRASNEYELHLDIVLGASAKHKETSQKATRGVVAESDGGSRTPATGVVAESDTNLNNEPGIEPDSPLTPHDILCRVLRPKTATDFIAHRKGLRKPVSVLAAERIVSKLQDCPNPDAVVDESISNGWQGVFPERKANGRPSNNNDGAAADMARRIGERFAARYVDRGTGPGSS